MIKRFVLTGLFLAALAAPAAAQDSPAKDTGFEVRRSQAGQPAQAEAATATGRKEPDIRAGAAGHGVRPPAPAPDAGRGAIEKLSGVWVEGPGFEVTYGGNYDGCAQRCLGNAKCVMIEYYRPERKCNLYSNMRPRLKGGSSDVGIRK